MHFLQALALQRRHPGEDLLTRVQCLLRGVPAIAAYFEALRAQGARGVHASRWMFVGYERVGKTTLAKALAGAAIDAAEPSTDGVSVREVVLPLPRQPGVSLRISVWDFAGQRVYYLTHQFFLSPRALYLLRWKWFLFWKTSND